MTLSGKIVQKYFRTLKNYFEEANSSSVYAKLIPETSF
jgi:hypothetical protein